MNRIDKIEYIKKHITDVEQRDSLDFIYFFVKAHIERVWEEDKK